MRTQGGEDGHIQGSLGGSLVKNLPAVQETWVQSLGREDPWRKEWQPTSVFLLGKSHGERSLAGYSLWGRKELDTTEQWNHHHGPRTEALGETNAAYTLIRMFSLRNCCIIHFCCLSFVTAAWTVSVCVRDVCVCLYVCSIISNPACSPPEGNRHELSLQCEQIPWSLREFSPPSSQGTL